MSYQVQILLPEDTDATSENLHEILTEFFDEAEEVKVELDGSTVTVTIDEWKCKIDLNELDSVAVESKEMAEMFAKERDDQDVIAASTKRFEVNCDPDPDMDYFNDYLEIVEQLEDFENAKTFDPTSAEFMN